MRDKLVALLGDSSFPLSYSLHSTFNFMVILDQVAASGWCNFRCSICSPWTDFLVSTMLRRLCQASHYRTLHGVWLILYVGTGFLCVFSGRNLDYDALSPAHPMHGQHWGILLVERGVGITVMSTILMIYYMFARRGDSVMSDIEHSGL